GSPCRPFTRAGTPKIRSLGRQGGRHRDDPCPRMSRSFLRIVDSLHPRAVLLENVPDLTVWQDGALLMELCEKLRVLEYRVEARVLGAFDHRVPQHRRRLFIVGVKQGIAYKWPAASR